MAYGTLSLLDELASSDASSVADFGEDRAFAEIEAALAAHNAQYADMFAMLAETTTDRQRRFGTQDAMRMDPLDELGLPDAQKISAGQTVGFPLNRLGIAVQWTRDYFLRARPAELAANISATLDADRLAGIRELKKALFGPTNYTAADRFVDGIDLAVKRLINADSSDVPLGPNGEEFDGASHTHYLGHGGSLTVADWQALITAVSEHFASGETRVLINQAQEATVRGYTSNFTPFIDARIRPALSERVAAGALATNNIYDREIGLLDAALVEVKPWVPAGYAIAVQIGAGIPRPLVRRVDARLGDGLRLVYDDERHPLRARAWERNQGFGVWNRVAAAILDVSNSSYTAPTIT